MPKPVSIGTSTSYSSGSSIFWKTRNDWNHSWSKLFNVADKFFTGFITGVIEVPDLYLAEFSLDATNTFEQLSMPILYTPTRIKVGEE